MYNRKYYESLARRVKVLESLLLEGKRDQEILNNFLGDEYYDKYNKVKGKIKDPEYKDIYKLIKKDPDDVKDYIDNVQSKSDVRRSDKKGAKKLYEDSDWIVYRITTYDAAKYYGKGTKWCISGNYDDHEERGEEYFYNYIDDYDLDGGYYFYINKNDPYTKFCVLQKENGRIYSIWNASDDDLGSENTVEMMLPEVSGVNLEAVNLEAVNLDDALLDGALRDNAALVKKVLSLGADVNTKDEYGETALMYAALNDDHKIVKLLIDAGADVNAKDEPGKTALMSAAHKGRLENVKLLIGSGADVNVEDEEGKTALIYAAKNYQDDVVKFLLDAGANVKPDDLLLYSAQSGDIALVKKALSMGADVNAKDTRGQTALIYARRYNHYEIAKLLIDAGAKSESRNRNRLNRKYL